jgi:hypothetical protein
VKKARPLRLSLGLLVFAVFRTGFGSAMAYLIIDGRRC